MPTGGVFDLNDPQIAVAGAPASYQSVGSPLIARDKQFKFTGAVRSERRTVEVSRPSHLEHLDEYITTVGISAMDDCSKSARRRDPAQESRNPDMTGETCNHHFKNLYTARVIFS